MELTPPERYPMPPSVDVDDLVNRVGEASSQGTQSVLRQILAKLDKVSVSEPVATQGVLHSPSAPLLCVVRNAALSQAHPNMT